MSARSNLGGFRAGAGRPKGTQNRRTLALSEKLLADGKCPAEALVRIAERAEAKGDMALAVDAWKAVLPYVHAKPKPVEFDPIQVVQLAKEISDARAKSTSETTTDFGDLLNNAETVVVSDVTKNSVN